VLVCRSEFARVSFKLKLTEGGGCGNAWVDTTTLVIDGYTGKHWPPLYPEQAWQKYTTLRAGSGAVQVPGMMPERDSERSGLAGAAPPRGGFPAGRVPTTPAGPNTSTQRLNLLTPTWGGAEMRPIPYLNARAPYRSSMPNYVWVGTAVPVERPLLVQVPVQVPVPVPAPPPRQADAIERACMVAGCPLLRRGSSTEGSCNAYYCKRHARAAWPGMQPVGHAMHPNAHQELHHDGPAHWLAWKGEQPTPATVWPGSQAPAVQVQATPTPELR
jgi:hypothetical protein